MATNSESKLLQAAWKIAMRTGKWEFTFDTEQRATRIRFGLYNAVKRVKAGLDIDKELLEASQECVVSLNGKTVTIVKRSSTDEFQKLLQSVGGLEVVEELTAPTISAEDQQIAESMAKTLKLLEEPPEQPQRPANPYYDRSKD